MGKPIPMKIGIHTTEYIGSIERNLGTEITHYQDEQKSIEIPSVATSEIGKVQTLRFGGGCRDSIKDYRR